METVTNSNGLVTVGLQGKTIVKYDNQKCETCGNDDVDCVKQIASGGHICIW